MIYPSTGKTEFAADGEPFFTGSAFSVLLAHEERMIEKIIPVSSPV
jgi:hypothetical protein